MKLPYAILAAAVLALAAAMALPSQPAVIATVDIEKVFATIAETNANEAKVRLMADSFTTDRDRMSRDLQDLQAELESYKAGTPAWNEAFRKVEEAVSSMRAQEAYAKIKLETSSAAMMRDLYARVKAGTTAIAKANKINYVLVNDSLAAIEETGMQGTKQQMALRRFLYADPGMDMTTELIAWLDADFVARGGKLPAAPASGSAPTAGTGTAP